MNDIVQLVNKPNFRVYQRGNACQNFKQVDIDFFNSDPGVEKTVRGLQGKKFKFNFTVLVGVVNMHHDAQKLSQLIKDDSVIQPDAINIVYTNNFTGPHNHLPMNTWVLFHRISHVIQARLNDLHLNMHFADADMWNVIARVLRPLKITNLGAQAGIPVEPTIALRAFLDATLTMRSARNGWIYNGLDYSGEVMAQKLVTGKVTLLRYEDMIERLSLLESIKEEKSKRMKLDFLGSRNYEFALTAMRSLDSHQFDRLIGKAERLLDASVDRMLEQMVGRVASF